jgi:hypothetical protein
MSGNTLLQTNPRENAAPAWLPEGAMPAVSNSMLQIDTGVPYFAAFFAFFSARFSFRLLVACFLTSFFVS